MRKLVAEHANKPLQLSFVAEYQRKLNELKDHFLLNVSHELRTPLTTLAGSLDLLFSLDEHLDAMERAELLNMARDGHEELVNPVNQILDATHVMSAHFCSVRSSLSAKTREEGARFSFSRTCSALYGHVEVSKEVKVWTDPRLLCQVLHHLFSNIFKYVPRQTEITMEARHKTWSNVLEKSREEQFRFHLSKRHANADARTAAEGEVGP